MRRPFRSIQRASLLFLVTAPIAAQAAREAPQGHAGVLRSYDLRSLFTGYEDQGWQQALFVPPVETTSSVRNTGLSRVDGASAAPVVVELLSQLLGDELREKGREILLDGDDHLMVLAPPALQARIEHVLKGMGEALRAETGIEVEVFSLSGGEAPELPPSNLLDEQATLRLASTLESHGATRERHLLHLRPGMTAVADTGRRIPFLMDYEVEIAQASYIFDPIVAEAREGLRVVLRGTPVPGGVRLSAVLRSSTLLGGVKKEQHDLRGLLANEKEGVKIVKGPRTVESVDIDLHAIAFDSFLPDERTLVVTTETEISGTAERHVVLLRRVGSRAPAVTVVDDGNRPRKLALVDSEVMRSPSLRVNQDRWDWVPGMDYPLVGATLETDPSLFLFDWIKKRYRVWRRIGPWALFVTDPSWDKGVGEIEELLANLEIETDVMSLSMDARAADGTGRLGFSVPLLVGSQCGVMVGRTSTALVDYDVEVAQLSAVADPQDVALYQGLALTLSSSRGRDRAVVLGLDGLVRLQEGPMRHLDLEGSVLGGIGLPRYMGVHLDDRVSFDGSAGRPLRVRAGDGAAITVDLELR